jgi:hypothetical protein
MMKHTEHKPTANSQSAGSRPAQAWRKALGALSGPLLRLHHYREVRAKVLHDAMFLSDRQRRQSNPADCDSARR